MSYSSAVDLALDIVSRNLERLQHSAWEAKAKFGYELSETVILCLEYCPGLRELIKEAWPDVESGVSKILEQGLQPICMGAIKRGEFHDFMNGTISDTKLPLGLKSCGDTFVSPLHVYLRSVGNFTNQRLPVPYKQQPPSYFKA
jgi:hypothetical protein